MGGWCVNHLPFVHFIGANSEEVWKQTQCVWRILKIDKLTIFWEGIYHWFLSAFGYIFSHSIPFLLVDFAFFFPWLCAHSTKRKEEKIKTAHIFQFSSSHVEMVYTQWIAFVFSITRSIFPPLPLQYTAYQYT